MSAEMQTTLQQIRERDTELIGYDEQDLSTANRDRRYLLNLVERMHLYVKLAREVPKSCEERERLDALLEELK